MRNKLAIRMRTALRVAFCLSVFMFAAAGAHAQDLEPRSYSNTPVGLNFLIAGYAYAEGKIAFDPCDIEVLVTRCDYEKCIDVRGYELQPVVVARGRPLEQACPIQDAHEIAAIPLDKQPVADGRSVHGSLWDRQAGGDRVLELFAKHGHHSAMNRHHPNWLTTALLLGGYLVAEKRLPAELAKRRAQCIHRLPTWPFFKPQYGRLTTDPARYTFEQEVSAFQHCSCRRLIFAPWLTTRYA